jgi:hypothetical protein
MILAKSAQPGADVVDVTDGFSTAELVVGVRAYQ